MSWFDLINLLLALAALTVAPACGFQPVYAPGGAGSELYRGLGSVVLGGLVISTLLTLVLVPTVFTVTMDARLAFSRWIENRRQSSV